MQIWDLKTVGIDLLHTSTAMSHHADPTLLPKDWMQCKCSCCRVAEAALYQCLERNMPTAVIMRMTCFMNFVDMCGTRLCMRVVYIGAELFELEAIKSVG